MSKVLIIGYGNTLRGDDAAGVRAAELIAKIILNSNIFICTSLSLNWRNKSAECDIVFFIDAQKDIIQLNVQLVVPGIKADQPHIPILSHRNLFFHLAAVVRAIPSKAYIIGIPASEFEFSEELSAKTELAIHQCVAIVEKCMKP